MEPEVRGWFARRVLAEGGTADDLEDIVQECLCAILQSYGRFEGRSSPRTWVYSICRNLLCQFRRQRRRMPRNLPDSADEEPRAPDAAIDPADVLTVRMAADSLPPRLRSVYELYYQNGLSVRDVAFFLRRPEGTVKYQLSEIRRKIGRLVL